MGYGRNKNSGLILCSKKLSMEMAKHMEEEA
jgi:hypothetical protein